MSSNPENWSATPEQVQAFVSQTCLEPVVVLDSVTQEVANHLRGEKQVDELYATLRSDETVNYISGRSALVFQNNATFRRQLSAADPRPQYYAFVRHWVAGVIKKKFPQLFDRLPSEFCMGAPL